MHGISTPLTPTQQTTSGHRPWSSSLAKYLFPPANIQCKWVFSKLKIHAVQMKRGQRPWAHAGYALVHNDIIYKS